LIFVQGGDCFRPSDLDLSPGTPRENRHLKVSVWPARMPLRRRRGKLTLAEGGVVRFQADGCAESVCSCADKTQGQLQKTRPNQRVFARSSCAATFRKGVVPFLLYRRSCCPGSQGRGVGHPSGCGCLRGGARRGSPTMVGCDVCSPRYLSRHGVFTRRIPFRTGLGIRC